MKLAPASNALDTAENTVSPPLVPSAALDNVDADACIGCGERGSSAANAGRTCRGIDEQHAHVHAHATVGENSLLNSRPPCKSPPPMFPPPPMLPPSAPPLGGCGGSGGCDEPAPLPPNDVAGEWYDVDLAVATDSGAPPARIASADKLGSECVCATPVAGDASVAGADSERSIPPAAPAADGDNIVGGTAASACEVGAAAANAGDTLFDATAAFWCGCV